MCNAASPQSLFLFTASAAGVPIACGASLLVSISPLKRRRQERPRSDPTCESGQKRNNRSNGGHDISNRSRKGIPLVFSDALPQSISNPVLFLVTALSLVHVHNSLGIECSLSQTGRENAIHVAARTCTEASKGVNSAN
jgi:hypothetical protein